MNIVLWVLQIVLAIKFTSVTVSHGFGTRGAEWEMGFERFGGLTRPLLVLVALLTFLTSVGLILPAATGILTWLTPWSAALLAGMMAVGVGLHVGCRETPNVVPGVVLFAMAAFVAYGRWMLVPFSE